MTIVFPFGTGDGRGMPVPGAGDVLVAPDFWAPAAPDGSRPGRALVSRRFTAPRMSAGTNSS